MSYWHTNKIYIHNNSHKMQKLAHCYSSHMLQDSSRRSVAHDLLEEFRVSQGGTLSSNDIMSTLPLLCFKGEICESFGWEQANSLCTYSKGKEYVNSAAAGGRFV